MSPPSMRKRKAPTLYRRDWEPVKSRIAELYVTENRPLKEIKETLELEFGFTAEIRQYRKCISDWNLDKNIKPAEMKAIVRKQQRRKLIEVQKNGLSFRVRGHEVEQQKIDRWMKRHDVRDSALYSPESVASTPSALSCQTISRPHSPLPSLAYSTTSEPPTRAISPSDLSEISLQRGVEAIGIPSTPWAFPETVSYALSPWTMSSNIAGYIVDSNTAPSTPSQEEMPKVVHTPLVFADESADPRARSWLEIAPIELKKAQYRGTLLVEYLSKNPDGTQSLVPIFAREYNNKRRLSF